MSWLAASLVVSVLLTALVNLALWVFPGLRRWLQEGLRRMAEPPTSGAEAATPRVRVIIPWKLMLVASLVLTVAVNVLARLLH